MLPPLEFVLYVKKDTNINISASDLIPYKVNSIIFKTFYFSNLKIFYCFK